ncbi:MAG: glutamyl-tRNA reductase [Acidimicrobiia bacterium]|nr:glutamyl-tRNA reductase [Acidimicrobiia bacterium]
MNLVLVGLSHKTAPVHIRERLHFPEPQLPQALELLRTRYEVRESMILSTCNRVEVLAQTAESPDGVHQLRDFICSFHKVPYDSLRDFLYDFTQLDAVRHVFRVAASLDSMVLGEPQILGQVKTAFTTAQNAGAIGATLSQLMNRAFFVAKRVRSETTIASSAVSISYAAVELAKKIFNDLKGKTVMILGAGKMSELAAKHLSGAGVSKVLVWNRTYQRAVELAELFKGEAIQTEDLFRHIERADIIISSTGSPAFILNKADGERMIHLRKNRPVFIIDIAVPRDVDPEINKVNNVFLYDIDDLRNVIDANLRQRQREAQSAEEIVRQEVDLFLEYARARDATPAIVMLREHWEAVRKEELARSRKRLGSLTSEQEAVIESLTQSLVNKMLHQPISELKRLSRQTLNPDEVAIIKRIFGLKD